MLGIIGGTGLSELSCMDEVRKLVIRTPYGEPSGPLSCGRILGIPVIFLARHGYGHTIPPHRVNYRANIWALNAEGVRRIVSVASVGGIRKNLHPGTLMVPDQLIDYTWGRAQTYFENELPVTHVDFTRPYDESLRQRILRAASNLGQQITDGGVYAVTQGPRLETAAEVDRLERDGAHVVGMTGMPEAVLARELGVAYASLCVVVNHAAGRGNSFDGIQLQDIETVLKGSMGQVRKLIEEVVRK